MLVKMKESLNIIDEEDLDIRNWELDGYKMVAIQAFIDYYYDNGKRSDELTSVVINDVPFDLYRKGLMNDNMLFYVPEHERFIDIGFGNEPDNINNSHVLVDMRTVNFKIPYIVTAEGRVVAFNNIDLSIVSGKAAKNCIVQRNSKSVNERCISSVIKRVHSYPKHRWLHDELDQAIFSVDSFGLSPLNTITLD
jgi:hypothetical protein